MTTRRTATVGTGEAAYQRLAQRTEEAQAAANLRVEAMFDNLLAEVRNVRREVQQVDTKHDGLERRMADVERQIVDTREEVQKRATNPAPSQIASAKTAIADATKSVPARVAAACLIFTTVIVGLNNIPDGLRWLENAYAILRGGEGSIVQPLAEPKHR